MTYKVVRVMAYIDREEFRRKLIDEKNFYPAIVARALEEMPAADVVEVKYGEWIRNERNIPKMKEFHKKGIATAMKATSIFYTCSCCNDWGTPIQKYCSGCGAKMDNVVNYESTKTIKIERRSE
jgi:hypothetical protein